MQFLLLFSLNTLLALFQFDGWRGDIEQPQANLILCPAPVLKLKVLLEGSYTYDGTTSKMKDNLRTNGASVSVAGYALDGSASIIPTTEPYSSLTGFTHKTGNNNSGQLVPSSVFATTGDNAIVDWVFVELRDATTSSTVIATCSALLQVDGDVVSYDAATSSVLSVVAFDNATNCGSYSVVVRHRNHLGIRSNSNVTLTNDANTTAFVDFTIATTVTAGTDARKTLTAITSPVGNALVMYAGNVVSSAPGTNVLRYSGPNNDRGPILAAIGGISVSATVRGYYSEDTNMDSVVRYSGPANDRAIILVNIGGISVSATLAEQL